MALFTERLKELRNINGVSQIEISKYLGISERNYRRYELGEVDPPSTMIVKIADYFDVSLDYLMGRSENKNRN